VEDDGCGCRCRSEGEFDGSVVEGDYAAALDCAARSSFFVTDVVVAVLPFKLRLNAPASSSFFAD